MLERRSLAGAEHQAHPGQRAGLVPGFGRDDRGDAVQRVSETPEPAFPALLRAFFDREGEHVGETPDAAILPHGTEEGLGGQDPIRRFLQLFDRQQKQPVAAEERVALGVEHRTEQVGPAGDFLPHQGGGALGLLRRNPVDHHHEVARLAREGLAQLDVEPPEIELGREHVGGIGIDLHCARGVDPGGDRADDREDRDGPGEAVRGPAPKREERARLAAFRIGRIVQGSPGVPGKTGVGPLILGRIAAESI